MEINYLPFTELLSTIVDNRGRTCPTVDFGIPLIATNCIKNESPYPSYEKIRYVSQETYDTWFRGHPIPGDLIFVTKGAPGRVCMVPDPIDFCIAQDMVAIRADDKKVYPKYLLAALRSNEVQSLIENMHVGTLIPHFKKGDFEKLLLPLPDRKTQEIIGDYYFDISAKIEINRRMNVTLEYIAQIIFKSWFVNFDPVRAKTDGRHPAGMDAETAKLFPSSFDMDVPKGWKVFQLGDFLSPTSNRIGIEDAPEYSATVYDLSLRDKNFNKTLSKSKEKNKRIVKNNLVFGLSRQTLNFGVMKEDIGSVSPVYEIFNIDTSVYIPELLEMFIRLKMDEYVDILKPAAREGQAIDRNYLLTKKILIPDMKVQLHYQEFCSAFRKQIAHNEKESRTLGSLRDSLLPKLMRGEVRVSEL